MSSSRIFGWVLLIYLFATMGGGGVFVVDGPRQMLVVHETEDDTPALANAIGSLRMGANEAYLKEKKHLLDIIDDDKVGPDGQPPALLTKFKPYALPEVLVIQPPDKLLAREKFTTAEAAMELLKRNGG